MSRLFGPIFQTAYVVEDIDGALDHWTRVLGVGPFFMFPTPLPFAWLKRDEVLTDEYDVLSHAALAYSGDMMIERSEEHTSELQSLMRISYAVFCLKKQTPHT